MAMKKDGASIIVFDYCEDCFQEMAGKKYTMMMENYMNHMSSTGDQQHGVRLLPHPALPLPTFQKFKFKDIFVHDNGVPTLFSGTLFIGILITLSLVIGLCFLEM